MTLRLAELAMALLAVGLFVGCSRGRDADGPEGADPPQTSAPATTAGRGPASASSTAGPAGPAATGPAGGAGTSSGGSNEPSGSAAAPAATSTSTSAAPAPVPAGGGAALPAACAGVAALDAALPPTVEQVAALLGAVRTLAADTVDPRAADARLLDLVPEARRIGADLARDGRALSGLVPDLEAAPGPDLGADVAGAAAAAAGAEVLLGEHLAAVDRIDDLVVEARAPAADAVAASAQRAAVLDWAAVRCASRDGG